MTEANYAKVVKLSAWSKERGRGMNELAQAWLLAQPQVCSVISGAKTVAHLQSNLKAADWKLTSQDLREIETLLT
jgi:aryl-alcohol dehydrogenase-like predicted oxidoreductase